MRPTDWLPDKSMARRSFEAAAADDNRDEEQQAEAALKALKERAAQAEIEALLDGEADGNDTFLEINSGAGGTEA